MSKSDLQTSMRAILDATRSYHPPIEDLLDYHEGHLDADREERMRSHLAACPECTRAVLDMASFPEIGSLDSQRPPAAGRWQRFRRRLAEEEAAKPRPTRRSLIRRPRKDGPPSPRWRRRLGSPPFSSLRFAQADGRGVSAHHPRADRGRAPRLRLGAGSHRAAGQPGDRRAHPGRRRYPRRADDPAPAGLRGRRGANPGAGRSPGLPGLELEIFDGRQPVWSTSELRRTPDGIFAIEITPGFLPAGMLPPEPFPVGAMNETATLPDPVCSLRPVDSPSIRRLG